MMPIFKLLLKKAGHYSRHRILVFSVFMLLAISSQGQNIQIADIITGNFSYIGELEVNHEGSRFYFVHGTRDSISINDRWIPLTPFSNSYFISVANHGIVIFAMDVVGSTLLPMASSLLLFKGFNTDTLFISDTVFVKEGPPNSVNLAVLEYDFEGNFIHGKHFPSSYNCRPGTVDAYARDGNIYITGTYDLDSLQLDDKIIGNWTGLQDVFVAELNSDFECQWLTRLGGDFGNDFPITIDVNSSFGVLTAGYFGSGYFQTCEDTLVNPYAAFTSDGYLSIMDFTGDCTWSEGISGLSTQIVTSAKFLSDGSVIVGGVHKGDAFLGDSVLEGTIQKSNGFLAKYNKDGTLVFANQLDGMGNHSITFLEVLSDHNIWVCGTFDSSPLIIGDFELFVRSPGLKDVFVAKYDRYGNPLFAQSFGGKDSDYIRKMVKGPDNSIFVVMETSSDTIDVGNEILVLDTEFSNAVVVKIDDTTTSVNTVDPSTPVLRIYPNPVATNDEIFIDVDKSIAATLHGITLFNLSGQMMTHYEPGGNLPLALQVPDFASGIYFLSFDFGTYRVSEKVVVVR